MEFSLLFICDAWTWTMNNVNSKPKNEISNFCLFVWIRVILCKRHRKANVSVCVCVSTNIIWCRLNVTTFQKSVICMRLNIEGGSGGSGLEGLYVNHCLLSLPPLCVRNVSMKIKYTTKYIQFAWPGALARIQCVGNTNRIYFKRIKIWIMLINLSLFDMKNGWTKSSSRRKKIA